MTTRSDFLAELRKSSLAASYGFDIYFSLLGFASVSAAIAGIHVCRVSQGFEI